jgi:uncharacterized membrane protein SpoIIM required for sporulation
MIIWDDLRSRFSRGAETDKGDIAAAALRSDRFRQAREADWKRLEVIVGELEKGRFRRLSDEDVLDLPVLYRTVASSLSVARETTLDAATLAYLESLVQRAWFQVYGPRASFTGWLRGFFAGGWSRAVRAIAPDIGIALAVMVAGTLVGWLLVAHDPAWYGALVQGETERVPSASREALKATLFGHKDQDGLGVFATFLFGHNSQIAILAYALGFALGVPSILLLVQNTGNLGAMLWVFHSKGLLLDFVGWLSIHGTTELFAILLAGASGIHVGRAIAFPGPRAVLASVASAGRRTAPVVLGVVLMLLVAGMLEGFARQLIEATPMRLAIGGGMLVFWLNYFFTFARKSR